MRNSATIELIGYVYGEPINPIADKYPNFISFSLSVTRKWKDKVGEEQKEITWYKCQSWSEELSKTIKNHVKQGMGLLIKGTPKSVAYIDKDGVAKSQIEVQIKDINMLTFPKDKFEEDSNKHFSDEKENSSSESGRYEFKEKPPLREPIELTDDEIPF